MIALTICSFSRLLIPQNWKKPPQITENLGPIDIDTDSKSVIAGSRSNLSGSIWNLQWPTWNRLRHKLIEVLSLFLVLFLWFLAILTGKKSLDEQMISGIDRARQARPRASTGQLGIDTCANQPQFFCKFWEPRRELDEQMISRIDRVCQTRVGTSAG